MGEYAVINYSNPARPWVGVARGGMGGGLKVCRFLLCFGEHTVDEFSKEKITFEKVCRLSSWWGPHPT